jgi:hypothetical protein
MSYTFNQTEVENNDYELLIEGEYEVTLEKINTAETQSGKKKLDITFRVKDIEGQEKFKNRLIWDTIWKERDTEFYNRKRLNSLLGTQRIQSGTVFENINEIIESLSNANVRIKVLKEFDEYRQKDVNRVHYYMSTQIEELKPKTLDQQIKASPKEETITLEDLEKELPF